MSDSLTSYQRVVCALNKEEPDRVPIFEWSIDEKVRNAILGRECTYEYFADQMELDAILVYPVMRKEYISSDTFIDEFGIERRRAGDEPYPVPIRAPLQTEKDVKKFVPADPLASYRMDQLKNVVSRFKGNKFIVFAVRDVFSWGRDLRGYENWLVDLVLHPSIVHALVEMSVTWAIKLAKWAAKKGADAIFSGDDIADNRGPLFSPKVYRTFFWKPFKKLVHSVKEGGLYYIKHTDGNVWDLLDVLVDSGIDCIDPIEPSAGMDIGKVKRIYGKRVCLKGNIDCRTTLVRETPKQVEDEVRKCISVASPGGGHILSSSNSIHSSVRPENYGAMINAAKKFGRYPIVC